MEIRQRIAVILCLGIGLASSGLTVAQSSPRLGEEIVMQIASRRDCMTSIFYSDAGKSIIES